jgi:3-oxoadipate enol-lactonase
MRQAMRSARRLMWPSSHEPEPPVPPANLPPCRALWIPGRGETFIREQDGPAAALPVLLLHGWTASADTTWFGVYGPLAEHHRLIAMDQRGHGRGIRAEERFSLEACADDAAGLLELLDTGPVIVVGYSLGGAVALRLWERHRALVAGLVMAATALAWRTTPRERLLWKSMGVFEIALRLGTGDGFVQRYLSYAVGSSPEVADLRAWVSGEFKRGYDRDVAEAGRALAAFDARELVDDVSVPCASVITCGDRLVRAAEQYDLANALGAPAFPLDGDHDSPLVRPKEFSDAVVRAVQSVAERRAADAAAPTG